MPSLSSLSLRAHSSFYGDHLIHHSRRYVSLSRCLSSPATPLRLTGTLLIQASRQRTIYLDYCIYVLNSHSPLSSFPPASLPSPPSSWMPTIFTNRLCLPSFTPANVLRPYGGEWLTLFVTIVPVSAHPTPLHQVAMLSRHCLAPASRKCQLLRWTLPMPVTSSASHCPTGKTTDALVQVGGGLSGVPICHPGPLLCAVVERCALPSDHVQNL